jgi:colanic acid/amylovoran biosynthesis glycosyltransferase
MNVVVSEALATGLPVIATRHSGLPDQVVDGRNGYLVEEGDAAGLAEKLAEFIAHPELWPAMSDAARAHVFTHFDASKLVEEQIALYREILREG